ERRHFASLLVTFAISGLWHGANWTYVLWGLLNAIYLIIGTLTKDVRNRFFAVIRMKEATLNRRLLMWASTFLLTCVGWLLFRAKTVADAEYILTHFATNWDFGRIGTDQFLMRQMPVAIAGIVLLEVVQLSQNRDLLSAFLARLPLTARWTGYATAVIVIIM